MGMRALVSVYDKTGLVGLAERLVGSGCEIVSSGGTAAALEAEGIPVTKVADVTAYPEMMGGRVKTLHPAIHGGILARGAQDDEELNSHGIERFDLVISNLYPFSETVASGANPEGVIEMIDIGGPAMIRAAAKNHRYVTVVTSPTQYDDVASAVESGGTDLDQRRELAAEAFFHTAAYDAAIVDWFGRDHVIPLRRISELRYGENPHQEAAVYTQAETAGWWSAATQHQGKAMSFNNYNDAEAAWRLVGDLGAGSVAVVKHANAAGAARGNSVDEAFDMAWDGDSLAAFGGVVAVNGTLDEATASKVADKFVEVVICREVSPEALELLAPKKSVRILTAELPHGRDRDLRRIEDGFLIQDRDTVEMTGWKAVSELEATPAQLESLKLAWVVSAHTKSNAIVVANGQQVVGVGAGDQSRVGAAERAVLKAAGRSHGGVAASDAFFPFRDGLDVLADAGIEAIVQPGGSRNDQQVIEAANARGIALVHTGRRHFRH